MSVGNTGWQHFLLGDFIGVFGKFSMTDRSFQEDSISDKSSFERFGGAS